MSMMGPGPGQRAPYAPGLIRRGKIGGIAALKGQAGAGGTGWLEICRIDNMTAGSPVTREGGNSDSASHTIHSAISNMKVEAPSSFFPVPKILLRIEVADGNDTGAAKTEMLVVAGTPVTVSGAAIYVSAQLFLDETGDVQAPPSVTGGIRVFITDAASEDVQPTRWVLPGAPYAPGTPLQASEQVTITPCRLRSWQGFNAAAAGTTYLMLFDFPGPAIATPMTVPNGTPPTLTIPLVAGAWFSNDFIESVRSFTWGLAWAASSTADVLTYDAAQSLRVDIELYAEQEPEGGA
jgi:hypothetical protein